VSTDLDVLVNARLVTGGIPEFVAAIETAGFALVGASPEAQRQDLALLLSLVAEPIELAGQLTKKDRRRLGLRSEMVDADQRAWASLSGDAADRGRAALRILHG